MSETYGGFLEAASVQNVRRVAPGILAGTVERNFNGTYQLDDDYEFFDEQFVPLGPTVFKWCAGEDYYEYKCGDKVRLFARQIWGEKLDESILGTVYQDAGPGRSVIVSVDPRNFEFRQIDNRGGLTLEVYPQQLRLERHGFKHTTVNSPDARWTRHGFEIASCYKDSWFKWLLS